MGLFHWLWPISQSQSMESLQRFSQMDSAHIEITLAASGIYEECALLFPGQIMEYAFKSSKPVEFNIHVHKGDQVINFVSHKEVSIKKDSFYHEKKEIYCLMWNNTQTQTIDVVYQFQIHEKKLEKPTEKPPAF